MKARAPSVKAGKSRSDCFCGTSPGPQDRAVRAEIPHFRDQSFPYSGGTGAFAGSVYNFSISSRYLA
ncbi:MAG: hypothetical protein ACLSUW_04040, partial [Akkermansia sp.]